MLDRALSERWWTQRQDAQGVVQKAQPASPAPPLVQYWPRMCSDGELSPFL